MPPRTPRGLLLVVLLGLSFMMSAVPAAADPPIVTENSNASRTVVWDFETATNLTLRDLELPVDRLILPWQEGSLTWVSGDDFVANGTLDAGLTDGAAGLELAADPGNHVAGGDFASDSDWGFVDGSTGNVTSWWDAANSVAVLGHNSASTESQWDSLDEVFARWDWAHSPATLGGIVQNLTGQLEGLGRLGMSINTEASGATWGAARYTAGTVDWSSADRFVVWVEASDVDPPLSLNITAVVAGEFRTTPETALVPGWQKVIIA